MIELDIFIEELELYNGKNLNKEEVHIRLLEIKEAIINNLL
tara:strand:+ start:295 stop:417 length:123 start_codon:yes stop_codon:yes gene_type:complete